MNDSKISWAIYKEGGYKTAVFYQDLDEDVYNQKYRGRLFCINGCRAKIKFTHRKDGPKFFSTWNKEGTLHNNECPYHIDYLNEIGRKRLEALYKKQSLNEKHIMNTIKNKFLALKEKLPVNDDTKTTTNRVKESGTDTIPVYSDDGNISDEHNGRVRIGSLDVKFITRDYINLRKCVFGIILNAYMGTTDSGSKYLYLNMKSNNNFSIYFPEAFYSSENNNLNNFITFYDNLKRIIETGEKLIFVGVGFISQKRTIQGLRLNILDKSHFQVNETSYDTIVYKGEIKNNIYVY